MTEQRLCRLDAIPDGGAKGIDIGEGPDQRGIILLRRGERVFAYENRCPHMGTPLETFPDRFLNQTGELLICSTHGARFRIADGFCVEGPCKGLSLTPLSVRIDEGCVVLEETDTG